MDNYPRIYLFAFSGVFAALTACAGNQNAAEGLFGRNLSDPATFHRSMAQTFMEKRDWTSAADQLQRSLRFDSEAAETHLLLGVIYRERGLASEAEESLERALELDPELAAAHSALGILFDRSDRSDEALAKHRQALELEPERADFHNNLGFSQFLRGSYLDAISSFRAALRFGGGPRVHNNLGFTYGRMGHFARAFREFERGGTAAQAHNNIGWVYEQNGDGVRAEASYREALRSDPQLAQAQRNLDRLLTQRPPAEGEIR